MFKFINSLCLFGIWWGGCYLLDIRKFNIKCIFLLAIFLFNIRELNTAGIVATQVNYWWPISFLITGLALYKMWQQHRKTWSYAASIVLFFIAANQEQYAVALFLIFSGIIAWNLFFYKQINFSAFAILIMLTAELVMVAICPGNMSRYHQEIKTWFPNWADIGFFTKMANNMIFCGKKYFFRWDTITLFFSVALLSALPAQSKRNLIYYLPLASYLAWLAGVNTPDENIQLAITCVNFSIYILTLCRISTSRDTKIIIFFILATGYVSRLMLAFSPTVFGSGFRTFTIFDFALIFAAFIMILPGLKNPGREGLSFGLIITLSLCQESLFIRYLLTDFNH